ncbi:DUF3987 domain-containing protein [Paraferrimonas haliotis]|uniref:DUF3987 domain-containing protein n=1 Tax=Paraferrimonas haliotis TaxID=2013866 RepID=A0AA37TLN5_9GAMM|nr:DUF3987 domain-containing protein [Paraferrimonas haliotis]GLS83444.1 hypothetical protein GCM10007894_14210 [Paraferrimonas haliotis]
MKRETFQNWRCTVFNSITEKRGKHAPIEWLADAVKNPTQEQKAQAKAIAPHSCESKTKEAVKAHNQMTMLWLDLDDSPLACAGDVHAQVDGITGKCLMFIHTTASHQQDGKGNRYRVLIPLAKPMPCDEWEKAQRALQERLESVGADECSARVQQIIFEPVQTASYEGKSYQGDLLDGHTIAALYQPTAIAEPTVHTQTNPVFDAANAVLSMENLLADYGYQRRGEKWLYPNSDSGRAGVEITSQGKYVSHHTSDPLNGGMPKDPLDVYAHWEHGGNPGKAVQRLAERHPSVRAAQEKQQREFSSTHTAQASQSHDLNWDEPKTLKVNLPPVPEFDTKLLPECLRAYCVDSSHNLDQAPNDFVAVTLLVCAAAVIGGQAKVKPKARAAWTEYPILWGACVGRPSSKKTPTINAGVELIRHCESVLAKDNSEALKERKVSNDIAEAQIQAKEEQYSVAIAEGDIDGAAKLAEAIEGERAKIIKPQKRRIMINDSTVEAIQIRMQQNPLGTLVLRDELSGWIQTMEQPNRRHERAFYLEMFNGGSYSVERVSRKPVEIESAIGFVLGGIQPSKLRGVLIDRDTGAGDDGLLERLQLAVMPDAKTPQYTDEAGNPFAKTQAENAFVSLLRVGKGGKPLICSFDKTAQVRFSEVSQSISNRLNAVDDAKGAVLGKYPAMIAKISLVIHLLEQAGAAGANQAQFTDVISLRSLEVAIKWSEYLEAHNDRITSYWRHEAQIKPTTTLLDRLDQLPNPFTKVQLKDKGWAGLGCPERRDTALKQLLDAGYIKEVAIKNPKGRDTIHYHSHPNFCG